MADIKQITVSAPINTAEDNSSNTNIVTNITTGEVSTKTLASITPSISTQTKKDTELNVVVTNMGEENIPDPTLFKRLDDISGYSEQVLKTVSKGLLESVTNSDAITSIQVEKILTELLSLSDLVTQIVAYNRTFDTDTAAVTEQLQAAVAKIFADTAVNTEFVSQLVAKLLEEAVAASDQTTLETNKNFEDLVDATDDILGEANIDDDQYAEFGKSLLDYTTIAELFNTVVDFNRVYTETATNVDLAQLGIQPLYQETTNIAEQTLAQFGKLQQDQATITEQALLNIDKLAETEQVTQQDQTTALVDKGLLFTATVTESQLIDTTKLVTETAVNTELVELATDKYFTENLASSETTVFDVNKLKEEEVFNTDLVSIEPDKSVTETASTADSITEFIAEKLLEDLVDATDDIFGEANVDDDQYAEFGKSLLDYSSVTDLVSTAADYNRELEDANSTADLLTLLIEPLYNDQTTSQEELTQEVGKSLADAATTTEQADKTVETTFSDVVDATDDIFGEANIDDDQYATFGKSVLESVTILEEFSTEAAFDRVLTETQFLSEVFAAATDKALSDNTNSSDTVTFVGGVSILDTTSISETKTLAMQSYFRDDYVEAGYVGEYYTY